MGSESLTVNSALRLPPMMTTLVFLLTDEAPQTIGDASTKKLVCHWQGELGQFITDGTHILTSAAQLTEQIFFQMWNQLRGNEQA